MQMKSKGTLYLIPVPLSEGSGVGWLPPATLEAILKLKVFIVEDIRSARRFLRSAGYQGDFGDMTFLILNEHTPSEELPAMLTPASGGRDTGLLSQAGVPCVADPGALIVSLAHRQHIRVVPLVGPSSILLALMASGFNGQCFSFYGYLPVKNPARINKIREIEAEAYRWDQTQIFIEAPYRNQQLFSDLVQSCREQSLLCIALNINMPDEKIQSQTIAWWKQNQPDLNKKPAVFLLYR